MTKENATQELRLNDTDSMSKKHKKVCTALNYTEQSFNLVSASSGCV